MSPTTPTLQNRAERLELANRLNREFYTRCFWHSPPDLVITEELLPFVIKGLRTYGGHRGFQLAGALRTIDCPSVESNANGSATSADTVARRSWSSESLPRLADS